MNVHLLLLLFLSQLSHIQATDSSGDKEEEEEEEEVVSSTVYSYLDTIKGDLCVARMDYSSFSKVPIKDNDSIMERYPLHISIMHQSYACIQSILFHVSNPVDLLKYEDSLGNRAIDYAIKYFPWISVKCLTFRMILDNDYIDNVIKSALETNPSQHLDLLTSITLRSNAPHCMFVKVLEKFMESKQSNSFAYKLFLEDYFAQVFPEPTVITINETSTTYTNIFIDNKFDFESFSDLVWYAIKFKCYSFLRSSTMIPYVKIPDAMTDVWINDAIMSKDPFIMKYVLNLLEEFELDYSAVLSITTEMTESSDLVDADEFWRALHVAFDLEFLPEDSSDQVNQVLSVLWKKEAFETLSDEEKTKYLGELPKFIHGTLLVDLMIALHNPVALHYFPDERKQIALDSPVYQDMSGNRTPVPTTLDLIACFAPKVFPHRWPKLINKSKYNDYTKATLRFVFSDKCNVASSLKGELLRYFDFSFFEYLESSHSKNITIGETTWLHAHTFFIEKLPVEFQQHKFIDYFIEHPRKYELIYQIVSEKNLKLSIAQIYQIIFNEQTLRSGKKILSALKLVYNLFELGLEEGASSDEITNLKGLLDVCYTQHVKKEDLNMISILKSKLEKLELKSEAALA